MSNRQTDLDLVNVFDHQMKTSLHEEYNQALSMLRVAPSYTLLDFRKILETICLTLAHKSDIEFCNDNLRQNIDHLHTTQIIDHQLNDICHQLRSLCNTGSHIREKDNKLRTNLENNANKARDFLIEIMQHILSFEFNISKFNNVSLVDNPSQERKELLYQSLEGKKPAQYFKVGQFYEGLAYDVQADKDGTK